MPLGKLMCWVCMAFFVFVLVLLTLGRYPPGADRHAAVVYCAGAGLAVYR
ncbi:hypothetical protein ACVXG7_31435 [Enterobacter hormaechei]